MKKVFLICGALVTMMLTTSVVFAATNAGTSTALASLCKNTNITFSDTAETTEYFRCTIQNGAIKVTSHIKTSIDYSTSVSKKFLTKTLPNDSSRLERIFKNGTGLTMKVSKNLNRPDVDDKLFYWVDNSWSLTKESLFDDSFDSDVVDVDSQAYKDAKATVEKMAQDYKTKLDAFAASSKKIGPALAASLVTQDDKTITNQISTPPKKLDNKKVVPHAVSKPVEADSWDLNQPQPATESEK